VPVRGLVDPRVRSIPYDALDVVRLRGYVGYQIHLLFEEGEEFVNLGAGEAAGVDVGAIRNHLMLKPKQPSVGTNLTIVTNKRVYEIAYSARQREPDPRIDDVVYALKFTYPSGAAAEALAAKSRVDAALATGAGGMVVNRNYSFCGRQSLRPSSAEDDGVQTRLRFGARSEYPAVFVKNEDGSESLVNFTVEGDGMVVHRIAREFVLRRGRLVGCVVNRAFDGSGRLLGSGTVSPAVERQIRSPGRE
jgi:type IV secretion system protein VirB9